MENKLILKRVAIATIIIVGLVLAFIVVARSDITKTKITKTNPLKGWKLLGVIPSATVTSALSPAILDDYKEFVQRLPFHKGRFGGYNERDVIQNVSVFGDAGGQHAIQILIPVDGTFLCYVLIYDKNNTRAKMIKYSAGQYSS
jgi:hypothetical protein